MVCTDYTFLLEIRYITSKELIFIFYLLFLQLMLCRVAALKSLPVHHLECRLYFSCGPLKSMHYYENLKCMSRSIF